MKKLDERLKSVVLHHEIPVISLSDRDEGYVLHGIENTGDKTETSCSAIIRHTRINLQHCNKLVVVHLVDDIDKCMLHEGYVIEKAALIQAEREEGLVGESPSEAAQRAFSMYNSLSEDKHVFQPGELVVAKPYGRFTAFPHPVKPSAFVRYLTVDEIEKLSGIVPEVSIFGADCLVAGINSADDTQLTVNMAISLFMKPYKKE